MSAGKLYLVATPIGNLEDITLRALRILKEADLILCEDTRRTRILLKQYSITTPSESYHEHNEALRLPRVLDFLRSGRSVALVSDAGTPLVSDPGSLLVRTCREQGIEVIPIPGPVAAIAALSASGLPTDSFLFAGFLPPRAGARRRKLEELAGIEATLVFYEAPHRILAALEDLVAVLGPRPACLAREVSKIHEEWLRGTLDQIFETLRTRSSIRGEITLVVQGGHGAPAANAYPVSIREHLEQEIRTTGGSRQEALRQVARQRNISRKEAYQRLLNEK